MTAAEAQVSTPLHRQSGLHADRPGIRIEEQSPTPKTLHEKLFGGKKLADRRGAAKALGRIKATSKSSVSVAASTEPPREEQKLCRARVLPRPGLFRRVLRRSERSCRSSAARRSSRRRARWRLRGRPCHGVLGHWGPADFLSWFRFCAFQSPLRKSEVRELATRRFASLRLRLQTETAA